MNLIDNNIHHSFNYKDKKITPCDFDSDMRKCFIDIETDYKGGHNREMSEQITAISFFDNYTDSFYTIAFFSSLCRQLFHKNLP